MRLKNSSIRLLQIGKLFKYLIELVFVPAEQSLSKRLLKTYVQALVTLSFGTSCEKHSKAVDGLTKLATLCQEKQFGSKLSPLPSFLMQHLDDPLFSYGLLRWILHNFDSISYYRTTYEGDVTPLFIIFLGRIATKHSLLRQHVFEVIWRILTKQFPKEFLALEIMELHQKLLPLMAHLVHLGL